MGFGGPSTSRGGCLVELVAVADDVALVATDPVHQSVHSFTQRAAERRQGIFHPLGYISIGSTGNISAEDLEANPERAAILRRRRRRAAGGLRPGVRNSTGRAVDPGAHSAPLGLSFAASPGLPGAHGPGVGRHPRLLEPQTARGAPEVSFFAWRDGILGSQQALPALAMCLP